VCYYLTMENEEFSPEIETKKSIWTTVTPFSKYVALSMFIALPFLGGWIGYTHAPEKVIEVEKTIVKEVFVEVFVSTQDYNHEYFQNLYQKQYDSDTEIKFLYQSKKTDSTYYRTFMHSSSPSRIVGYQASTASFFATDFYIDFVVSDSPSLSGRYISNVINYSSSTTGIEIIDLETGTKVKTINVFDTESLRSGECGYAGYTFEIEWVGTSTLRYGVYSSAPLQNEECDAELIEYREIKF
jgi:hypothetical protein